MSDHDDFLSDAEVAHLRAQAAKIDGHVSGGNVFARRPNPRHMARVLGVLHLMQQMGVIARAPLEQQIHTLPPAIISYAISVCELEVTEDADGMEFDRGMHVTRDLVLLSHADTLERLFGSRPVTMTELDAYVALQETGS